MHVSGTCSTPTARRDRDRELYFGANVRTAFAVGQARGVVLLAAGQRGPLTLLHPPAGQGRRLRPRPRRQGAGGEDGRPVARAGRAADARPRRRRSGRGHLRPESRPAGRALAPGTARPRRGPRRWGGDDRADLRDRGRAPRRPRVVDCGGVGYRLAVSARDAQGGAGGRAARGAARHLVVRDDALRPVRLCHRAGARSVPDAARRAVGRPQGRPRRALRCAAAGAAGCGGGGGRRPPAGGARGRQADRRADRRRAAREGRAALADEAIWCAGATTRPGWPARR